MTSTDAQHFYSELKPFSDFQQLPDDSIFQPVPSTWFVVIADVEGSTTEVTTGRYEVVNTAGAGAIAIVQSVFKKDLMAFVFGGDGATFLIPPHRIDEVKLALSNYKRFCLAQFGLKLRIGVVGVSEIIGSGQKIEAAKFSGAGGKCTVFLRGGGIMWADYTIKSSPRKYCLPERNDGIEMPLSSLSCRWKPLPSGKGKILTILAQPRLFDNTKVFESLLAQFQAILGGSLETSNPVQEDGLRYQGFWATLKLEFPFVASKFSGAFLKRFFEILLCQWAFRLKLPVPFEAESYVKQMSKHSDYRKYDDMLRLVLDCTPKEIDDIHSCLQSAFERGDIFFGTYESSHALMTCLLENLSEGGHIHLIDGSNGGYTMAAKKLNLQRYGGEVPRIAAG